MKTAKIKVIANFALEFLKIILSPIAIAVIVGILIYFGVGSIEGVDEYFTMIIEKLKELR